ncbi:hypothetical protein [Streptomyces sp. NPDC007369]|uniref:hypothetical protein n=1 Tax=Streptomyces sp. NPDC007369 TaxID=3154589 RepID=UPI0034115CA1
MAPHRDISPDHCENCRRVFAALEDHQLADPETWLTTTEIGKVVGLKKRATQDHLAHLFAKGRIDVDRRTPLRRGVGQPPLPGAQEWAAAILAPDPTCAKCLIALAGWGWQGQVSEDELARAAGISLRSVQRHRAHLIRADLVVFRPVVLQTDDGRNIGRRPDRFTLMSGITAPRLDGAAWDEAPAVAARVIDRVRWFVGATDETRMNAIKSVTWCLRNGWPEGALLQALDATENRTAYNPGGYLSRLLSKLPTEYVVPARDVAHREVAPERMADCAICDTPFKTRTPGIVFCGGTRCLNPDEAVMRPNAPVVKIA